jgi:hypothetical protein
MLEFNPMHRISAEDILKDSYFDDVRLPEQEIFDVCSINLTFDDAELSVEQLRELVVEELKECSTMVITKD